MTGYRAQITELLEVVGVRSPDAYSWLGQIFERRPSDADEDASNPERWITRALRIRLYGDFFITGRPAPASGPRPLGPEADRTLLTDRLSAANRGAGAADPGWTILRRDGDQTVVTRNALTLWARPEQVIDLGHGTGAGAAVALRMPSERRGISEGFYTLLGDAGAIDMSVPIDRLYWHLRPNGGRALVAALSDTLNRARLCFRMKTVNDPDAARRCDTAVLYVRRADREAALALARAVHPQVAAHMLDAVPALTLRLAPGLAFAEDPGGSESYGGNRCRLLAEALVVAWAAGDRGSGRMAHIERRFRQEGIALDRPFLSPGSPVDRRLLEAAA